MASCKDTLSSSTLPPARLVDDARDALRFGLIEATSNAGGSAAMSALADIIAKATICIVRYYLLPDSTFSRGHPLIRFFTNP